MPSLRVLEHVENFWIRLFYKTNQESVPEHVQTANGAFPRFTKKIFPAPETSQLEGSYQTVTFSLALAKGAEQAPIWNLSVVGSFSAVSLLETRAS